MGHHLQRAHPVLRAAQLHAGPRAWPRPSASGGSSPRAPMHQPEHGGLGWRPEQDRGGGEHLRRGVGAMASRSPRTSLRNCMRRASSLTGWERRPQPAKSRRKAGTATRSPPGGKIDNLGTTETPSTHTDAHWIGPEAAPLKPRNCCNPGAKAPHFRPEGEGTTPFGARAAPEAPRSGPRSGPRPCAGCRTRTTGSGRSRWSNPAGCG